MSTTVNTSNNSPETAKSLGLKIISVVGLTLFAGFYVNAWQRSLAEYAQQQEQEEETVVATSTTNTAPIVANTSTSSEPTVAPSASVVSSAVGTTESVSAVNTVAATETASTETEVTLTVPETQAAPKVITDSSTLEKLNSMLYNQIDQAWQQYPTFSENLAYRVTMDSAGMVAKYENINKAASDYVGETPLAKLTNSSTADANKPTAEYLVLLTPSGTLQVNQWVTK